MDWKNIAAKAISFFLILSGLYQMFCSLESIFFIHPAFKPSLPGEALVAEEGLIEKALILYAGMVIDGIYGVTLLFKPAEKVKIAHLIIGFFIAIASIFFITKTPLTTDPVQQFLSKLLGS